MTYRYTPLTEPDAIRLIAVQPCPDISAQVQCKLFHTTLQRAREDIVDHYTALSYVWGDPEDRTLIFIEGLPIHVTKNLDDALRHIRDPTRILHIWADVVCINQEDVVERNQQVAQMGEIYKSAHHSVIFLGTCDAETEAALSQIPRKSFRHPSPGTEFDYDFVRAIRSVSSRPWFYRVWIFQEPALSHDPRVQCGRFRCSWDEFYRSASNLQAQESDSSLAHPRKLDKYLEILSSMQSAREYCRKIKYKDQSDRHEERSKLFEILQSRRGFGVLDDRDMIFAHLGLFSKAMVEVDYGLSTVEIFERIAMAYEGIHNSLDVLQYCEDVDLSKRLKGLASWAPDWSLNSSCPSIPIQPEYPALYFTQRTFLRLPNLMCSTACIVSTITSLSRELNDIAMPEDLDNNSSPHQWFRSKHQWWIDYLGDDQQLLSEIPGRQIIIALHSALKEPWNRRIQSDGPIVISELMCKKNGTASIIDGRKIARLSLAEPTFNPYGRIPGGIDLGIVPRFSQIGDKICLLPGYDTAIVIRDVVGVIDEKVDSRVRIIMREPEGSKRPVRHVQIIGHCKIDHLRPHELHWNSELLYKGYKLPEGDALLAIH